jgi:hypothetical protein
MRRQIGLAIAGEVELFERQRLVGRLFENTRSKRHTPVCDEPGLADIQGHDLSVHVDPERAFP